MGLYLSTMIIYQITNKINGDFYIGKTSKTIEERFQKHKYSARYNHDTHLYRAMRKYGEENYSIKIVESQVDITNIDARERYYIETMRPKYNMTLGGDGGDTSNSTKFKQSMKEYHSRKPRQEYATYGNLGKKASQETKDKIGKANSYPVVCEGIEYASIKEAQDYYKSIGTPKSVRKRIDSPKHTDWYRVRPKREFIPIQVYDGEV